MTKDRATATFQNITENSLNALRDEIINGDFTWLLTAPNVEDAYNRFVDQRFEMYKRHLLLKKITRSRKILKPWITPELLKNISHKNVLYHKFVKTKDIAILKQVKTYSNKLNREIKVRRAQYFYEEFENCSHRTDIVWKKLNSVLNRNKSKPTIKKMTINGSEISGTTLANEFNKYFISHSTNDVVTDFSKFMPARNHQSIFLEPVDQSEVQAVFTSMKNSSACDVEGMQIRPLKYFLDILAPYLTCLFNL